MPRKCHTDFYAFEGNGSPLPDDELRCHVYFRNNTDDAVYGKGMYRNGAFVDCETEAKTLGFPIDVGNQAEWRAIGWRPFRDDRAPYVERYGTLPDWPDDVPPKSL